MRQRISRKLGLSEATQLARLEMSSGVLHLLRRRVMLLKCSERLQRKHFHSDQIIH